MANVLMNEDGYTEDAVFVDPVGNIGNVEFSFRAAGAKEWYRYKFAAKPDGDEVHRLMVDIIERHLTKWDVNSASEEKGVAKIVGNVAKVPHQVLEHMLDAIFRYVKTKKGSEKREEDRKN